MSDEAKLLFRAMALDLFRNSKPKDLSDIDAGLQLLRVAIACLQETLPTESVLAALDHYRDVVAQDLPPQLHDMPAAGEA